MRVIQLFILCLLTGAVLTACGTADKSQTDEKNGASGTEQEENNSSKQANENENSGESQKVRVSEKKITYTMNREQKEETAFLKESENQDYSLYVLPEYVLTGEEPGKDVLYDNKDDGLFMRIELLPSNATIDQETETAKSQLESVNPQVNEMKSVEGHDWLKGASIYTAENENEKVSIYLIPQEKHILKLSIFTTSKENVEDPFLKMAETIEEI